MTFLLDQAFFTGMLLGLAVIVIRVIFLPIGPPKTGDEPEDQDRSLNKKLKELEKWR